MRLSARQIETFLAIMRLGTATGAANVLHTSQPSVTRTLRQLEDATGLALFDRRGGRLHPTPEAREFLAAVEASFTGLERIAHAAETILRRKRGQVRVGSLPAFAQGFMAAAFSAFLAHRPEIHLSLAPLVARDLMRALREGRIDLGVVAFEVAPAADLWAERFTEMNEVALVPAGHRLARKRRISLGELDGEPLIVADPADPYRRRMDLVMRDLGRRPRTIIETVTSHGVGAMVAEGIGVGILNPITALDFAGPRAVMVAIEEPLPFVTTLVAPRREGRDAATAAFVETLKQERDRSLARSMAWRPETPAPAGKDA